MNPLERASPLRMRGSNVALLHTQLRQFDYAIPGAERSNWHFGKSTVKTMLDFRQERGLDATGLVNELRIFGHTPFSGERLRRDESPIPANTLRDPLQPECIKMVAEWSLS